MNKLLVVAKNQDTYFIKRLINEVGQDGLSLYNPWADPEPRDFDRVLFRTTGVYQSDLDLVFARNCSKPLMNPLFGLETFRSKSSQYRFFETHNISSLPWCWMTDWVPSPGMHLVKPDFGQGGWGIQVFDRDGLMKWREGQKTKGDLSWVIQPYTPAPELRIFFLGSERIALRRIQAPHQVAANFSSEGSAELTAIPSHLSFEVERLIQKSGAYYGAIDLLETSSGPKFLELNVVPGIEQLEKITGLNIIQKLLTANFFCQLN